MDMVENLVIEVHCVSDDCYSIIIFGKIIETLSDYEDIDGFIDEFCEEWNIDTFSLMVNEY